VAENTADKALQIARLDTRLCLRLAKVAFSDWADQVRSHENYYTIGSITTKITTRLVAVKAVIENCCGD